MKKGIGASPKKPEITSEERAVRRLPAPQKGVVLTIPLRLWPAYMALHGIEPKAYERHILIVQKAETP